MKRILYTPLLICTLLFGACSAESDALIEKEKQWISEVLDYSPAPGQFINTTIGTLEGAQTLVGGLSLHGLTLGGFGGSVTFRFAKSIPNKSGDDFAIYGNAFDGSSEPGIVMVSADVNKNGVADDPWYELAGSEYHKSGTLRNYAITYFNPRSNVATPIRWEDNQGNSGELANNGLHAQSYWPAWNQEESSTFSGTRLAENASIVDYQHYLAAYAWGYVDNFSAEYMPDMANRFNLDWAVDATGNPVSLTEVHFVKVYSAMRQEAGAIGETSTELRGGAILM